ncbi:MAG: helix-turn-helix transcriptional regulator [Pseudomonadota bacterium]
MDRFDRIYQLHRVLSGRRVPISLAELTERLECSEPTVKRSIAAMRDHLAAPIVYDRERNGYYYEAEGVPANWELPGLWFSADELQALLALEHLLSTLSPGLLSEELGPFRKRIESMLSRREAGTGALYERLRILSMGARSVEPVLFRSLAAGLSGRRRLELVYRSRSREESTSRNVSPQRLVHYRDNWYLDAWCHMRQGLRIFAVDRIDSATVLDEAADDLTDAELDENLARSYGIFSGVPRATAILRFSAHMARWVAEEQWHPRQQGQWLTDGRYELTVPYADPTELVRDILRFGADVEVVRPETLRQLVSRQLAAALEQYA